MQKLTFALMFHRAPKSTEDPTPQAMAQSIQIATVIDPDAVRPSFTKIAGDTAVMTNEVAMSHDNQLFFEWGTIKFDGDINTLSFSSIGAGSVLGTPDADGFSHGTVMWKVDSGTGMFKGAIGAITSNFLINLDTDELFDYHFYLLYLP